MTTTGPMVRQTFPIRQHDEDPPLLVVIASIVHQYHTGTERRGAAPRSFAILSRIVLPQKTMTKRSFSSSNNSISATANDHAGFVTANGNLRSILAHPMGLPLSAFLNDTPLGTLDPRYDKHYPRGKLNLDENAYDSVFSNTMTLWNGKTELGFTKILAENTTELFKDTGTCMDVYDQEGLKEGNDAGEKKTGTFDLAFGPKASAVALFEVGLGQDNWWKKFHHGLQYMQIMRETQDNEEKLRFKGPMLLVTICFNKPTPHNQEPPAARFGVFLCTLKEQNKPEFRLSLLWRKQTATTDDASKAFGKILQACQYCKAWRDVEKESIPYIYLGPNCCKLGNEVLRSYDTRFRSTERKPHLYLLHGAGGKSIIFPKEERAVEVLSIEDHSWNKADFDFGVLAGVLVDRQWLWSFTGKLLVIATPFREGQHDATKPADFLPIVRHLEYLHEQNVVHGDIRAFNIVFGTTAEGPSDEEGGASGGVFKASQGCLIDFDFGGNLDSNPRYPEGYMKVLGDGSRIGTARAEIQTHEDWYALAYVIFALHEFSVRVPDIPTSSSVLRGQEDSLFSQQERVWRAFKCLKEGDDDSVAIENLKEFLQGADEAGLRVTQGRSFAECFKTSRPASSYATGSPPKK